MSRSIVDWSRLAHELYKAKGEHETLCGECEGVGCNDNGYPLCKRGRVPVDHESPTRIASRLALIHLEISRAVECVVRGETETHWDLCCDEIHAADGSTQCSHCRPFGLPIALAGVFLRLCDLAESQTWDLPECLSNAQRVGQSQEEMVAGTARLHERCSAIFTATDLRQRHAAFYAAVELLRHLHDLTQVIGVNLLAMAELLYAHEATIVP